MDLEETKALLGGLYHVRSRIRRLEFPIERVVVGRHQDSILLILGDPLTQERDIEPLRPAQLVELNGGLPKLVIILAVGERWVRVSLMPSAIERRGGRMVFPTRMVRVSQEWFGPALPVGRD